MDLKSTLIGLALMGLAFFLISKNSYDQQKRETLSENQTPQTQPAESSSATSPSGGIISEVDPSASDSDALISPIEPDKTPDKALRENNTSDSIEEATYTIENDFIRVVFTNRGGAIKEVAFLQYPETKGATLPYRFNAGNDTPALSLSYSRDGISTEAFAPVYTVEAIDNGSIVFSHELKPGLTLQRHYRIDREKEGATPYIIQHTTRFINNSESSFNIDALYVSLGTSAPTEADPYGQYLNFGYYNGKKTRFIKSNAFKARNGFMGIGQRAERNAISEQTSVTWASVKNQFFATILTPHSTLATGFHTQPQTLPNRLNANETEQGITGQLIFRLDALLPDTEQVLNMDYYVGPKEFPRLKQLGNQEDRIMQFGWFSLLSEWLLLALISIEDFSGNYGVAIIIMTIIIRLILWPMTLHSSRSMKRMAKLQGPMKELQEKHKGKPQKLQKEMAKLYKEHKINPVAGCLPILLQFPIFLSFFYMLRTASELRFAEFLWIKDLSQPENIISWGFEIPFIGSYLNILPLLMGATMFYQMKMTPGTLDRLQQKLFLFMPVIFTFVCYSFSSGLVLYWTVSSVLSILQQKLTNAQTDKENPKPPASPSKDSVKTPSTKKGKELSPSRKRVTGKTNPRKK